MWKIRTIIFIIECIVEYPGGKGRGMGRRIGSGREAGKSGQRAFRITGGVFRKRGLLSGSGFAIIYPLVGSPEGWPVRQRLRPGYGGCFGGEKVSCRPMRWGKDRFRGCPEIQARRENRKELAFMVNLLLAIIYLAFVSLGLPDALLGAAWPMMHLQFGVPVSYMGVVSVIISLGTIASSLLSDRMTRRWGAGKVTAVSVLATALALLGFSLGNSFWMLCLLAIPYGLGAGGVDAALNNYVALHYASRHMSWLHCMWGVGASLGPAIMGYALTGGRGWNAGYRYVAALQMLLTAALFISLPLWKGSAQAGQAEQTEREPLTLRQVWSIPGAREVILAFFCYCALEQTAGPWASSYFVLAEGLPEEEAASLASLFYVGITLGRVVSGFLTMRYTDGQMIRLGQGILTAGVALVLLPLGKTAAIPGLQLIGLGCAPIYPCIIHSTPDHFGAENSPAVVGVQMASAYMGSLVMPPLYGVLARYLGAGLFGWYLLAILAVMVVMSEKLNKIDAAKAA